MFTITTIILFFPGSSIISDIIIVAVARRREQQPGIVHNVLVKVFSYLQECISVGAMLGERSRNLHSLCVC
jgi:hypothetical protein